MKKFVQENFTIIVLVIALLGLLKSCNDTREISKLRKEFVEMEGRQAILRQIEGLQSEKRMIQATDRKILDVQRQTEIENEIKSLEEKIK